MTTVAALKVVVTGDAGSLKGALTESRAQVAALGNEGVATANKLKAAEDALYGLAAGAPRVDFLLKQAGGSGAKSMALATHEVTNLSYQMNDVAMMLASGQSPFVVMMQQGMQVSQIFGQRGLGSILPAIGTGIMSLISPTTLLLAGITALGYAGSYVFNAMRDEVVSTDDALATHEDNIRRLKDAYGDAGKGLKAYASESSAVLAFLAVQSADQLKVSLRAEAMTAAEDMGSMTYSGFRASRDNIAFNDPIKALHQSALEGEPDIRRFREEVTKIAQADKANRELQAMASALLEATVNADKLSRALEATDPAIRKNAQSAADAASQLSDYTKAMEGLSKLGAPAQTDRDRALSGFQNSMKEAQDLHERTAAIEAYGAALARIRDGEIAETTKAFTKLSDSQSDAAAKLEIERKMIGASAAERAQALAIIQAEQQLRQTGIALSSREAQAYLQQAAAMAALSVQIEREQAVRKLVTSQSEAKAKAEVELALIGASSEARTRVIALLETERQIRAAGIDVTSREADALRDQAEALAGLTTELERQQDAWNSVKSAGEGAIDGFVQKLGKGDISGALQSLGDDIMKTTLQLAVANPIKNFMFGSNHGTLNDVVQGGFAGKLFGKGDKGPLDAASGAISAMTSVAAMDVTASIVNISGGGISGGIGGGLASGLSSGNAIPANDNSNAGKIWNFFQSKGLKDFQISAIMGNLQAESGLNPGAVNPNGGATGLAQHLGSRLTGLKAFGGGSVPGLEGQLSYIWKELQSSESDVLKNLLSSTNLRQATGAFVGFERPEGYTSANPEGTHDFGKRLSYASGLLEKFGGTTADATNATAGFGKGIASAISSIGSMGGSASFIGPMKPSATTGAPSLFGSLFAGFDQALGSIFGFDTGGWTGDGHPSNVAGLVHEEEFVVKAGPAAKFRPLLEAINTNKLPGYAKGGWVGSAPQGSSGAMGGGGTVVQVIDNAGVSKRTETERDGNGTDIVRVVLDRVGSEMGAGRYDGQLGGRFGAKPVRVAR